MMMIRPANRFLPRLLAAALLTLPVVGLLGVLGGCQSATEVNRPGTDAAIAAKWMAGSFDSLDQAKADRDFRIIELHMMPIWTERKDGFWLYVEQAAAESPETPYRQRVYRVHNLDDGKVRSDVFELPGDPLRFAGGWKDITKLALLHPDQLVPREGCSITMTRRGDEFVGGTEGSGCESSLRGASFATSEVTLKETTLTSWDRGWKSDGAQAWGAVKGPYVFVKR